MAEAVNIDVPGTGRAAGLKVRKPGRSPGASWLTSPFRESSARSDLKWVFGLPFTFWLGLFMAALSLFLVTGRENATGTVSAMQQQILAQPELTGDLPVSAPDFYAFLSSPGFADAVYENPGLMQEKIDAIPDYPPGMQVSPEETDEETAARRGSPGAGLRQTLGIYSAPVKLLSNDVHSKTGEFLTVFLVLLLVTGIPYLLLSRRLGRFVSLGVSTAVASLPVMGVMLLLNSRIAGFLAESRQATGEEEGKRMAAGVMEPFTDGVLGSAISTYRLFVIAAAACIAAAAAGCVYRRFRRPA